MIDISLQNFEADLINASMQQPVLLDIWAPWCGPCKALGPVLEKLEVAYAGRFKLAKLNSDEQPEISGQLSQMFGVRSIPFCVMFKGGQPVDGFVGALPEGEVRNFLDKHVPSSDYDARFELAQTHFAAQRFTQAMDELLEIIMRDKAWNGELARKNYVAILELMGKAAPAKPEAAAPKGTLEVAGKVSAAPSDPVV